MYSAMDVQTLPQIYTTHHQHNISREPLSIMSRRHQQLNGQHIPPQLNNKKIYQKVCEWYDSWAPWQKKRLLCGLTNMCSTTQLEALATSLEPLFHRDFVTMVKKRYPSASFRHAAEFERKKKEKEAIKQKRMQEKMDQFYATQQKKDENDEVNHEGDTNGELQMKESYSVLAEKIVSSAMFDALDTVKKSLADETLLNIASSADALGNIPAHQNSTEKESHQTNSDSDWFFGKEEKDRAKDEAKSATEKEQSVESEEEPLQSVSRFNIFSVSNSYLASLGEHMPIDPKMSSQHHNALSGLHVSTNPFLAKSVDSTLINPASAHSRHRSAGKVSSSFATVDFLLKEEKDRKLAPFQAEMRSGKVSKPLYVQDISVPVQNMFKSVKFFGESPRTGNSFIRPEKRKLKAIFEEQIMQVWQWMEGWEEYERLNLLSVVIKQSETDMLNYMAQCLYQRLQERVNVNWLSDRQLLLIFSYLPVEDIATCTKVCQRWKYLCAVEELWMVKCIELGANHGIRNLPEVVAHANPGNEEIDWRLAYKELTHITEEAKASVPVPQTLTFEGSTPEGMRRVNGKFVPSSRRPSTVSTLSSWKTLESEGPEIGTAAKLAKESQKLKESYRREKEQEAEEAARLLQQHASDMTGSRGSVGYLASSPIKSKSGGGLLIRRAKRSESRTSKTQMNIGLSKDKLPGIEASPDGSRPISQWVDREKSGSAGDGEVAQDVRHDLVQANDLLGKSWSSHSLQWQRLHGLDKSYQTALRRKHSQDPKYAGTVKSVRRVRKFMGHMDGVLCLEYDTRRLLSGSMDRSIRIWDIRTGTSIHKLYGHKGGVACLVFDRTRLYSGSWDTTVMAWDLVHFNRLAVMTGHKGSVSAVCMNDQHVFSSSHDGTVRVWLRENHSCLKTLSLHQSHIMTMVLDQGHIITGSSDKTIKITDVSSMETLRVFKSKEPVHRLIVQHRLIISTNPAGQVIFWDRQSGEAEAAIQAHTANIHTIAYHDGRFFTASNDFMIKEWDLVNLTCVRSMRGHKSIVHNVKVDEKKLISCDSSGCIRIWDFYIPVLSVENKPRDDIIQPQVLHESELKVEEEEKEEEKENKVEQGKS